MKIEIEIPDEDIEKLEELMRNTDLLPAKLRNKGIFKQYLHEFFTMFAKIMIRKLYEGTLALEAGVITLEEFEKQMMGEGVKIAIEAEVKTAIKTEKKKDEEETK